MRETRLESSKLTKAKMDGANLTRSNLRGVDFQKASFIKANISYSDMRRAKLQGAWFENVKAEQVMVYGKAPWLEGSKAEIDVEMIKAPNWDD